MPIRTDRVGGGLESGTINLTRRMTMAYAAGIGSARPRYFNDEQPDCLMAPPSYCVSLEWRILNDERFRNILGLSQEEAWRGIHVLQDTRFFAPVRPRHSVSVSGAIEQIRPTRLGAYVQVVLKLEDRTKAGVLSETRWGVIYRDVETVGAPQGGAADETKQIPIDEHWAHRKVVHIPANLSHVYTECAAIWNPIHTERLEARRVGFANPILHGTATWAIVGESLIDSYASGNASRLARLSCRFKTPVEPGASVTILSRPARASPGCFEFRAENAAGLAILEYGVAEFLMN
jgi:acyl dehydratase